MEQDASRESATGPEPKPHFERFGPGVPMVSSRSSVDEIDQARRSGNLSWDDYARLLRGHPEAARLLAEFRLSGGRDSQGRLRELEDLGNLPSSKNND